jgi:hypothetical protein
MENVEGSENDESRKIYILPDRYHKGIQNYGFLEKM